MSMAEDAKKHYDESGDKYGSLSIDKKYLTELYTTLKCLRDHTSNYAEGLRILDLACGCGELLLEFLKNGASFVSGMDISSTMISASASTLAEISSDRFSLHIGDCLSSEVLESVYSSVKFDNITANWLINYSESVDKLRSFFKTCHGLLNPKGRIFCIFTNDSMIDNLEESESKVHIVTSYYKILEKFDTHAHAQLRLINPKTSEVIIDTQINIFRKNTIVQCLEETGFRVLRISPIDIRDDYAEFGYTIDQFRAYTDEIGIVYCLLAERD
ncbi:hypothetical protein SteCoe_22483 [Stentor coeruleus]|uniref:Methyltransferase type 12 domain-containing protein n=1 Tax=Stentor coeruleus TaxID=5963 RepID=A0A1R2BM93_9CILI|nr:hypothetical protein SteCoe_22483 [Stentor coeruleus]